jgi:Ca2+-binding RTX toxin-like protein
VRRQRQRHCVRWRRRQPGGAIGNDRLTGGPGADRCSGGSGTDAATDFAAAEGDTTDGTIP